MSNIIYEIYSKIRIALPGGQKYLLREISAGGTVGSNIRFYSRTHISIDMTRPWLLTLGDNVMLTRGVIILTHDYSKAVMKNFYGDDIGEGAETIIGNNVFVGMNSVILMGSHIGNNVIIGAGSIVHGTIPDNVVVAGNPARVICTLEEHYEKRKQRTSTEAIKCAQRYYAAKGIAPTPYDMRYFKSLFSSENGASKLKIWDDYNSFLKAADIPIEK